MLSYTTTLTLDIKEDRKDRKDKTLPKISKGSKEGPKEHIITLEMVYASLSNSDSYKHTKKVKITQLFINRVTLYQSIDRLIDKEIHSEGLNALQTFVYNLKIGKYSKLLLNTKTINSYLLSNPNGTISVQSIGGYFYELKVQEDLLKALEEVTKYIYQV